MLTFLSCSSLSIAASLSCSFLCCSCRAWRLFSSSRFPLSKFSRFLSSNVTVEKKKPHFIKQHHVHWLWFHISQICFVNNSFSGTIFPLKYYGNFAFTTQTTAVDSRLLLTVWAATVHVQIHHLVISCLCCSPSPPQFLLGHSYDLTEHCHFVHAFKNKR